MTTEELESWAALLELVREGRARRPIDRTLAFYLSTVLSCRLAVRRLIEQL